MIIGYARCSTADQNLDWQVDALKQYGCETIFQENFTGTTKERPELSILLRTLRKGDTIIICELTRLSRSVKDSSTLSRRMTRQRRISSP